MLKNQYGIATSSSATPVSHAEDAQPNETIYKRRHEHPPQIGSAWRREPAIQRGGPWTQFGIRGNGWRGRANFRSSRGGHHLNQNQGQPQRSIHHSVPPIATLPDVEYHISSSPSSSSSQIKSSQPLKPDSPVLREDRLAQAEPHYRSSVDVPTFSSPKFSDHQLDYLWLHRSRSPSPKLPESSLKRRKIEHHPIHATDSDLVISQPIKSHPITEPMPANKPLLPGRHRRVEGSAPIPTQRSMEPPVSPLIVSNILPEVKQEPHTPSPARSLRMERSLTTTSCKFYPIPELCKKSCPGFKENRRLFFTEKMQELKRLGLTRIKAFFRDDGLVIEWKSRVPVWSDTLLPEVTNLASAIKQAHQMNHQRSLKSNPKQKRQSIDRLSGDKDNNNSSLGPNRSKRPRHSLGDNCVQNRAIKVEMVESPTIPLENSSPKLLPFPVHSSHPSTTPVPLLDTSGLICLDTEVVHQFDADLADAEPLNTPDTQEQQMSAMDVDAPTATTQRPRPVRRLLFKPVLPVRRNQPTTSSVQDSTLLTSDSAKPLSANQPTISSIQDSTLLTSDSAKSLSENLSVTEGHSKRDGTWVNSQSDYVPVQEKMTPPCPRPPLPSPRPRLSSHGPSQSHPSPIPQPLRIVTQESSTEGVSESCMLTPPPQPSRDSQIVEEVEVQEMKASLSKDEDHGNTTDPDAELVVDLLIHGTPEEFNNPLSNVYRENLQLHTSYQDEQKKDEEPSVSAEKDNRLSNSCQGLQLHTSHQDEEPSVLAEEDTSVIEMLATQFIQRYLQLFDVDRLKLETAYAKNALFSCRIHHVQEPSFSMAGLFAPESSESKQGPYLSRSRASISAIQKGRAQIVNRLLKLGPHRFCPRGVPRAVNYDVVLLPSSTTGGSVLLTIHGQVVNPHLAGPHMDHVLSVDQSLVLRRRELEDEDEDEDERVDGFGQTISSAITSNLWPLVVVSHQMTVRDATPLSLEQIDGLASRIQSS